jgi:hypothetical protein
MTTAEFVKLETRLLREFPGFVVKGRLLFRSPTEGLLQGIHFDGSDFDKISFYVTFFVMPLCVPSEHLYLNYGSRVRNKRGGDRWSKDAPDLVAELSLALESQAMPFLRVCSSLMSFVDIAASSFSATPRGLQARAFTLARAGRFDTAIELLDQLLSQVDRSVRWQKQIAVLSQGLREKLVSSPEKAQQQLEAWETETLRNLGILKTI